MNFDTDTLIEAIAHQESGGRYDAVSPVNRNGQRAYGKYQILASNIPAWSREVLGYPVSVKEFVSNPDIQDTIAKTKISQYAEKHGTPEDVAAVWFSGRPLAGNNSADVTGTNVPSYVKSVAGHYNRLYEGKQQNDDLLSKIEQAEAEAKQQYDILSKLEAAEKEAQTLQQPAQTVTQESSQAVEPPAETGGIFAPRQTPEQIAQNPMLNALDERVTGEEIMAGVNNFNNSTQQGIGGLLQRGASLIDKGFGTNLRDKTDNYLANRQASADADKEKYPTTAGVGNILGMAPPAALTVAATGGGSSIPAAVGSGYLSGVSSTFDTEGQSQMRGAIGAGAGLLLGGLSKGITSTSGANNPASPKILAGGKEFDIPIRMEDVAAPGSGIRSYSENVLENTLGAGVKPARMAQASKTTAAIGKTIDDVTGGAVPATPGDLVKTLQAGAKQLDDVKAALFNKRDALAAAENVQVKPVNYVSAIDEQINKLKTMGQTPEVKTLINELEALRVADDNLTLYHGTTPDRANSIIKEGLKGSNIIPSLSNSSDEALGFGLLRAEREGLPNWDSAGRVLKISIPKTEAGKYINPVIDTIKKGKGIDNFGINDLIPSKYITELSKAGDDAAVPYQVLLNRSQQIGSMTSAEGLRGQVAKQIYKAVSKDLDSSTGSAAFNQANRQATDFYTKQYLPIKDNQQIQSILSGNMPEKDILNKFASDKFVKDLKPILSTENKKVVNSALLNDAKQAATDVKSELISNKAFASNVDKYKFSLPQLVGDENAAKLSRLNDTLRSTSRSFDAMANPQTGQTVSRTAAQVGSATLPLVAGATSAISPATGAIMGTGYLANVLLGRLGNRPELMQSIAKGSVPVTQYGTPLTGILTGRLTRKEKE